MKKYYLLLLFCIVATSLASCAPGEESLDSSTPIPTLTVVSSPAVSPDLSDNSSAPPAEAESESEDTKSTPHANEELNWLDNKMLLYARQQEVALLPVGSPEPTATRTLGEQANNSASASSVRFWSLSALTSKAYLEEDIFQIFYGEVERSSDLSRYFLNFRPSLSPNGSLLLLPGIGGYSGPGSTDGTGLWLTDLKTGDSINILDQAEVAAWDPDSTHIAYIKNETLFSYSLADSQSTPLVQKAAMNDFYVAWSPDGKSIAFLTSEMSESNGNSNDTIWLYQLENAQSQIVVSLEGRRGEYTSSDLAWAPSGAYLRYRDQVFSLTGAEIASELSGEIIWLPGDQLLQVSDEGFRIYNLDGTITSDFGTEFTTGWALSPDNSQIAFSQSNAEIGGSDISIFYPATQHTELIASIPLEQIQIMRWVTDDYLVLDDESNNSPIWRLHLSAEPAFTPIVDDGILIDVK